MIPCSCTFQLCVLQDTYLFAWRAWDALLPSPTKGCMTRWGTRLGEEGRANGLDIIFVYISKAGLLARRKLAYCKKQRLSPVSWFDHVSTVHRGRGTGCFFFFVYVLLYTGCFCFRLSIKALLV